jgi:hypothetical protein
MTMFTKELQYPTFVASALDLLASQPQEPILGDFAPPHERVLASSVRHLLQGPRFSHMDDPATMLLTDAWRRLERSGVLETRLLGRATEPLDPSESVTWLQKVART